MHPSRARRALRPVTIRFLLGSLAAILLGRPSPASPTIVEETESNETTGSADLLQQSEIGSGSIALPVGDSIDFWRRSNVSAGDLVFARIENEGAVPSQNSRLWLYGSGGTDFFRQEDVRAFPFSALGGVAIPTSGNLFLRVRESTSLSMVGYRLYQAIVNPSTDAATEAEPNDTPASANLVSHPMMTGSIVNASHVDVFHFEAAAGTGAMVVLDNDPEKNGAICEAHVQILDRDGTTVLAENPDDIATTASSANAAETCGPVALGDAGRYFVRVRQNRLAPSDSTYRFVLFLDGAPVQAVAPSPSPSPTATASPTPTPPPTATPTTTVSPSRTASPTASPTGTATPAPTGSGTPTPTPTPGPTNVPTATPTLAPTVTPTASPTPSRLSNLSTRGFVGTGPDVMIGGLIVRGTGPRLVLVSGIGPDLANFGVPGTLANPTLLLFQGGTALDSNDDWRESPEAARIGASGFAPNHDLEAAILAELPPGEYTAILSGVGQSDPARTGVGLVQAFDLTEDSPASGPEDRLFNLSTRLPVGRDERVMIGGFTVRGDRPLRVLVRGLGPTLGQAPFNVAGAMDDPELVILSGSTVVRSNTDWGLGEDAATIEVLGLAPPDPREPAILLELPPGAYTGIVSGANGTGGVALLEVYEAEGP